MYEKFLIISKLVKYISLADMEEFVFDIRQDGARFCYSSKQHATCTFT